MNRILPRIDSRLHALPVAAKRNVTRALVGLGLLALGYYFSWWLQNGRVLRPVLMPLFALAVVYTLVQVITAWWTYLHIEIPPEKTAPAGLTVDVFVPVYSEDAALVATTLAAAVAIRYPHRTFLLDDSRSDGMRRLAESLGAEYVRRQGREDAKAGNVNHALALSRADFVTIFDVDHVPEPDFLDVVLGHFDDPKIGFVQALVAHRNQNETFVARASSGQSDDVFGPTSMGWHGCGAALVWGAHCTFRRAALDSIGGYRPGLAEDLHTSLALHAAGWRSVYVPRLVARGLTTADLRAHFIQHLKWSRGVLGALFEGGFGRLARLSPSQISCYLTRFSYYLIGPVVLVHIVMLATALVTGFETRGYFQHVFPAVAMIVLVRKVVGAMWERDPSAGWQLTGTALALSTWPVYVFSLLLVLFRLPLPHIPTPKRARGGNYLPLVLPQLLAVGLLAAGIVRALLRGWGASHPVWIFTAVAVILVHSVVLLGVREAWRLPQEAPPSPSPMKPFGVPGAPEPEPVRDVV